MFFHYFDISVVLSALVLRSLIPFIIWTGLMHLILRILTFWNILSQKMFDLFFKWWYSSDVNGVLLYSIWPSPKYILIIGVLSLRRYIIYVGLLSSPDVDYHLVWDDIELKWKIMWSYGQLSAMLDDIRQQQMIFNYSRWYSSYVNGVLQHLIIARVGRCLSKRDEFFDSINVYYHHFHFTILILILTSRLQINVSSQDNINPID
jgi:hypothetical protein